MNKKQAAEQIGGFSKARSIAKATPISCATFIRAYPDSQTLIVTPENFQEFLAV